MREGGPGRDGGAAGAVSCVAATMSTGTTPSVVYWARYAGLANRLRALVGYKALADLLECPFYLCWENNAHCPAAFEELFVPHGIEVIPRDRIAAHRSAGGIVGDTSDWFTQIGKQHDFGGTTRDRFLRRSIDNLKSLSLRPELARAVDQFAGAHQLSDRTGLHIRYTDNVAAHRRWAGKIRGFEHENASRLEGFEAYVSREIDASSDVQIFLATDNQGVERRFRRRFGNHIITYPKTYQGTLSWWIGRFRSGPAFRTTPMSYAAIEFYLLARCRKLIGTYFSSFAQLACLIYGAEIYHVAGIEVRETRTGAKFRYLYENEPAPGASGATGT